MPGKRGHYCKACGQYRANEKFSGRGHNTHICKDCAKLPKNEDAVIAKLQNLPDDIHSLSNSQFSWLKERTKDKCPKIRELAQEIYSRYFGDLAPKPASTEEYDTLPVFDPKECDETGLPWWMH